MRDGNGLHRVAQVRADLGESPVWEARKGLLYVVDRAGGKINVLRPQAQVQTIHQSAARIGALGQTDQGNLIFTENASVALLDVATGAVCRRTAAVHLACGAGAAGCVALRGLLKNAKTPQAPWFTLGADLPAARPAPHFMLAP